MAKYRKRPTIVVEAIQWVDHENFAWSKDWVYPHSKSETQFEPFIKGFEELEVLRRIPDGCAAICEQCGKPLDDHGFIKTLEGEHIVCPDDWIIKGVKGEFYPCKPDVFEKIYEKVEHET